MRNLMLVNLVALLLAPQAQAFGPASASPQADEYDSYRWNRAHHENEEAPSDTGDWYEWWYYKAVLPETGEAVLFTYGIVNPGDTAGSNPASKAFLSFAHLNSGTFIEQKFPISSFQASYERPDVRISGNAATDRRITGQLESPSPASRRVAWDIQIERDWSWEAMGWIMKADGLSNIYWYPAQASAFMTGWVELNGRRIELKHAPAYQDRNWGRSFPKWWSWLVSNHFENSPGTVLASGGGRPSLFGVIDPVDAFVIGLRHEGHEYVFRTTEGHSIHIDIRYGKWELEAKNRSGERIVISAYAPPGKFVDLPFITPEGKTFHDYEALLGDIRVKLYKDDQLVADLLTHEGGIEYGSYDLYGAGLDGLMLHVDAGPGDDGHPR